MLSFSNPEITQCLEHVEILKDIEQKVANHYMQQQAQRVKEIAILKEKAKDILVEYLLKRVNELFYKVVYAKDFIDSFDRNVKKFTPEDSLIFKDDHFLEIANQAFYAKNTLRGNDFLQLCQLIDKINENNISIILISLSKKKTILTTRLESKSENLSAAITQIFWLLNESENNKNKFIAEKKKELFIDLTKHFITNETMTLFLNSETARFTELADTINPELKERIELFIKQRDDLEREYYKPDSRTEAQKKLDQQCAYDHGNFGDYSYGMTYKQFITQYEQVNSTIRKLEGKLVDVPAEIKNIKVEIRNHQAFVLDQKTFFNYEFFYKLLSCKFPNKEDRQSVMHITMDCILNNMFQKKFLLRECFKNIGLFGGADEAGNDVVNYITDCMMRLK